MNRYTVTVTDWAGVRHYEGHHRRKSDAANGALRADENRERAPLAGGPDDAPSVRVEVELEERRVRGRRTTGTRRVR